MAFIEINNLSKKFAQNSKKLFGKKEYLTALNNINLTINRGETLGLVGESGCGKSTLGRILLRLIEADNGQIIFDGQDLLALKGKKLRQFRHNLQLIFQDPYSSLNPRMKIKEIIAEPLLIHKLTAKGSETDKRVAELLEQVGLSQKILGKYPHQFSGGQRQRICIARALAVNPRFIVADEPVSALDVSIRAQIINLLVDLQKRLNLTMLFISHDLNVIRYLADRTVVMYLGKIVEIVPEAKAEVLHPYTKALLEAVPQVTEQNTKKIILKGEIPSPLNPPRGCVFHPRCPIAEERCRQELPEFKEKAANHPVACHAVARRACHAVARRACHLLKDK